MHCHRPVVALDAGHGPTTPSNSHRESIATAPNKELACRNRTGRWPNRHPVVAYGPGRAKHVPSEPRGPMIRDESSTERSTLRLILSRWWIIAGAALLGMVMALILSQQQQPTFESSAKYVLAVDPEVQDPDDVASALSVLRNRQIATTFAEILQSQTLLDRAVRTLGDEIEEFESRALVLPESNVVTLTVRTDDASAAHEVNSLIGVDGQAELAMTYPIYYAILLESPRTPTSAVSPVPVRDALFGAAIGAFLGLVVATVWPSSGLPLPQPVEIESARPEKRAKSGGEK